MTDIFFGKKLELVDAVCHNDLAQCFKDERVKDDLNFFVQHVDDWLSDDVFESPNIVDLCFAQLQLYRFDIEENPVETSVSENDDDNMYDIHDNSIHSVLEKRLKMLQKCVIHCIISLVPKGKEDDMTCLSRIDVEQFSQDSDVDEVVGSVGASFCDDNSKKVFESIWKHGAPAFEEAMIGLGKEELERLTKKWGDLLFFRMNREKQVKWTITTDFFLRWQTRWNAKVWERCLQLSFFLPLIHVKFPNPIWNSVALNIIDCSMDEEERSFQQRKLKKEHDNSFELVMKDRCNWPLIFMNLIREFAHFGLRRWAHICTGISLMFNAIMTETGHLCAREFVSDILYTFLSSRYLFEVRSSMPIVEMLKSLLVRTYFPSIFSGHLIHVVNSVETDNTDGYVFDESEPVDNKKRVKDIICDPLFSKGQLHPYVDLGMAEFI